MLTIPPFLQICNVCHGHCHPVTWAVKNLLVAIEKSHLHFTALFSHQSLTCCFLVAATILKFDLSIRMRKPWMTSAEVSCLSSRWTRKDRASATPSSPRCVSSSCLSSGTKLSSSQPSWPWRTRGPQCWRGPSELSSSWPFCQVCQGFKKNIVLNFVESEIIASSLKCVEE